MDHQQLRNLVFEKTGLKVDSDDPIFALVALNEAVLTEAIERQVARLNVAAQELARQARAPGAGAEFTAPAAAAPATAPPFAFVTPIPGAAFFEPRELRLLAASAALCVLSAALALGGHALLSPPAPPILAPILAPALTPAQAAAISQGEKLARAVQKLDPKSRALIQTEMQKP
ncbi:hypothetical protein AAKU55_002930 [Oxalobacteraceae bacterium GrIS 1.11]